MSTEVATHRFMTAPRRRRSERGIDADEPAAVEALAHIRVSLRRGLSPEQLSARNGGAVDLSSSTIYR